jgi:hypothetical protein
MGLVSWVRAALASRPSIVEARLGELKRAVYAIDLEEAERQVSDWLRSGDGVDVSFGEIDATALASLPPSARRIFGWFPKIEAGGMALGGELVANSATMPDKVLIGEDLEHAQVFVGRGIESLWIAEPGQVLDDDLPDPYPSLAHYLLVVRETMKPNWWTGSFG